MRGRARTIAVNDAAFVAPWADALYACDGDWWNVHKGCAEFAGQRWTQDFEAARKWDLAWVRSENRQGLSTDRRTIRQGSNSGYQAVNLAVLFGAARIVLIGLDMHTESHFFGEHPGHLRKAMPFGKWIECFGLMAPELKAAGVEVINCTPGSALGCFPKMELGCALSA